MKIVKSVLFIFTFLLVISCSKKAEDLLQEQRFFNFYIDYKKQLFKSVRIKKINFDSIRDFHKISKEEIELINAEIRKEPTIWYSFNEKLLKYLDSTISIEDSIKKFKSDSVKMTMFRYKEPELWKKSQDLKRKNIKLKEERDKILIDRGEKKPPKKPKNPRYSYSKGYGEKPHSRAKR